MSPRSVAGVLVSWLLVADACAEEAPPQDPPPPATPWHWEGAVGPVISYAPDYSGASTRKVSWSLGYYLRYGRISLSNVGGFVTRRNQDDIFRGLGLDLKRDDRLRLNVALRVDRGRKSADTRGLQGLENIERTLRARFSATWTLPDGWKVGTGLNADLLGRGGGNVLDAGLSHDARWSPSTTWAASAGLTAGDRRYMQTWYGVSEAGSAATGFPVYQPGAGLREATLGTTWRTEVGERWIVLTSASVGRLLGPAAQSPLTTSPSSWGASMGVAWRF